MNIIIGVTVVALLLAGCSSNTRPTARQEQAPRAPQCESKVRFSGWNVSFTGLEIPRITATSGTPTVLTYKLASGTVKQDQLQRAEKLTQALAVLESSNCEFFFGLPLNDPLRATVLNYHQQTRNLIVSTLGGLADATSTEDAEEVLDGSQKEANQQQAAKQDQATEGSE